MGDLTELVGGGNPYDFLIDNPLKKTVNIFTKDGRNLLKKIPKNFYRFKNGGADQFEQI